MQSIFLAYSAYLASHLPWSLVFWCTSIMGIEVFGSTSREDNAAIQRSVYASTYKCDGRKFGYVCGPYFVGHMAHGEQAMSWLVCSPLTYKNLIGPRELKSIRRHVIKTLPIFERMGNFSNVWFKRRIIDIPNHEPSISQAWAIDAIQHHHVTYGHTVAYIWGKPGVGKSMLGPMLATKLEGSYCSTLKPWQPGDTLAHLCSEVEPTQEQPLILVFDEFDIILNDLGKHTHTKMPISVQDKIGWNSLLDQIQWRMYPNIILLLTTNKNPDEISDQTLIRRKRVDLTFEIL